MISRIPNVSRLFFGLTVLFLTLWANLAHGDNTVIGGAATSDKEVRYTCKNHTIDIHRLKYANATQVSEFNADWLGTSVPWSSSYTTKGLGEPATWGGWLESTRPVTRTCELWSGPYVVKFGAWTWAQGEGHWPTVTIIHDGKTVIPTTVLGRCDKSRYGETGICKRFAVRVFVFEAVDGFRDGKPIGINKANVTLYRIRKDIDIAK